MKIKSKSTILIFIVLLMDFSAIGLISTSEGKVLDALSRIKEPKIYINSLNPSFQEFKNGTPAKIWEEEIIGRIVVSPLGNTPNTGQGITLNSNIENNWTTGINATGYLSEDIEELYEKSIENINRTGTLVLAFLATDIEVLNETLFSDERTRIVIDEILRFAEEVGDAAIILTGNYCTAKILMYMLWLTERDRRINEIYLVVLTHGVLNETSQIHGMLMHGENGVAVVNGETLKYLAKILRLKRLDKLKFVYLPFCNMGREKEIHSDSSVVAFFEEYSKAQILTYEGETYLNGEYIASIQSILSSGTYELIEENVYFPVQVIDNFTSQTVEGYLEFTVIDEIEELNSTINPYEIYDSNENVTLGSRFRHETTSGGNYRVTVHGKRVKATIHHGTPPRSYMRKKLKHISYQVPPKCKTFGARGPKIDFKHKAKSIPLVAGRFWKPPKSEKKYFGNSPVGKLRTSIDEIKRTILIVDEIFNTIYKNYYEIKHAVYRWIDATFNAPWNKWMRGPIKTTLDNTVFRGANFIINFAKQYLKTIICIAYNLKNSGESLGELVAALIIAAIAKLAKGILKYFSWTINKLLKTLSNVLGVDLSWVKKILDSWIDPNIKFLDNAVAYSESTFKSAAQKFTNAIIKPFNWIWNQIKNLFDTLWSNFIDFSVDNYLTLAYLLSELAVEGKLPEKLVRSIMNNAGKILDFIISIQPIEKRLESWFKIYYVWLTSALIAGKIRIEIPESWKTIVSRDVEKTNKMANGRVENLHKTLYDILGDKVKHTNLLRMDDVMIVFRRGLSNIKWRDVHFPEEIIGRIERIVLNKELIEKLKDKKLVEIDENGKIKRIVLDYDKTGRKFHYWYGEVNIVQVIHTHIDGKPVAFAIVWEGYLNWFTDPDEDKNLKNSKDKYFEERIKDGIFYGENGDIRALMSEFKPCKVETEDFTLKGYRIVLGLKIKVTPGKEGINVRTLEDKFDESYKKLIPTELVQKLIESNPELKKKFESKRRVEFLYRFDNGLGIDDGVLGRDWISKIGKVEQLVKTQVDFWNKYVEKCKVEKGKMPNFFDTVAQSILEIHPVMTDNTVETVIKLCDPPFLNEPPMAHTELTLTLKKVSERLNIEGLSEQKSSVEDIKIKVENYIKENFGEFYEKVHKEFLQKIEEIEGKERAKLEKTKSADEINKILSKPVNEVSNKIFEGSGSWNYELLDTVRKERYELRSKARSEIYSGNLNKIVSDGNVEKIFVELPTDPQKEGVKFLTGHIEKSLKSEKIKSVYKKILGKACNMGTSTIFIVIFVTASFLGTRFGMEIYNILPEDAKTTLKSGSQKFKVYMLLACVSYALVNVDDYQDFTKVIKRVKDEGTLKDVAKVLLQTFLGCLLNGILIGMLLEEEGDIILADEIIPYIARTIFGNNAWIFEKIIWPIVDTTVQIFGNGGPIMYLAGTAIGSIVIQILQQVIN